MSPHYLVGSKKKFLIHADLLRRYCSVKFQSEAYNGLKQTTTRLFSIFAHWLYYRRLELPSGKEDQGPSSFENEELVTLYAYAHKHGVPLLCDDVMSRFISHAKFNARGISREVIEHLFANKIASDSKLFEWVACSWGQKANKEDVNWLTRQVHVFNTTQAVNFVELAWCEQLVEEPHDLSNACDYHEHPLLFGKRHPDRTSPVLWPFEYVPHPEAQSESVPTDSRTTPWKRTSTTPSPFTAISDPPVSRASLSQHIQQGKLQNGLPLRRNLPIHQTVLPD